MDRPLIPSNHLEKGAAFLDALACAHDEGGLVNGVKPATRAFIAADLAELMAYKFRTREALLSPWLRTQSLSLVHAWRGVGKTHVALNVAYAVASGGNWLGWAASAPRKVLYLDGEMPGASIQQRLSAIRETATFEPSSGYLRILTPDMQPNGVTPNLATVEGRKAVNEMIEPDTALIVVDNLSALVRGAGPENDAQSWEMVADWALQLRARGHAILFVHHSGKNGNQRGTSKKEDILDVVLALRRPSGYEIREGARFEIHFEKEREHRGSDVSPIEARLCEDEQGTSRWLWHTVEDAEMLRAAALKGEGASQAEIAAELGKSRHQVARLIRRAHESGRASSPTFQRGGAHAPKPRSPSTEDRRG